jgi:hypothetical protein
LEERPKARLLEMAAQSKSFIEDSLALVEESRWRDRGIGEYLCYWFWLAIP